VYCVVYYYYYYLSLILKTPTGHEFLDYLIGSNPEPLSFSPCVSNCSFAAARADKLIVLYK
jgi:hypothetical protein